MNTPIAPEQHSHVNICQGVIVRCTSTDSFIARYPNAAATTHMNAVETADVAADWMMLFWTAFRPAVARAVTARKTAPRKAAMTLMFGPMPSLSTIYGYAIETTAETMMAPLIDCQVISGRCDTRTSVIQGDGEVIF